MTLEEFWPAVADKMRKSQYFDMTNENALDQRMSVNQIQDFLLGKQYGSN